MWLCLKWVCEPHLHVLTFLNSCSILSFFVMMGSNNNPSASSVASSSYVWRGDWSIDESYHHFRRRYYSELYHCQIPWHHPHLSWSILRLWQYHQQCLTVQKQLLHEVSLSYHRLIDVLSLHWLSSSLSTLLWFTLPSSLMVNNY